MSSSANGAPTISENANINPNTVGTGDFNVIAVYFTNVPSQDQPQGSITVQTAPTVRTATYNQRRDDVRAELCLESVYGLLRWRTQQPVGSARQLLRLRHPRCAGRGRSLVFDFRPTIGGSPNPNFDPNMRVPIYRRQPDAILDDTGRSDLSAGALGGATSILQSASGLTLALAARANLRSLRQPHGSERHHRAFTRSRRASIFIKADEKGRVTYILANLRPGKEIPFNKIGDVEKLPSRTIELLPGMSFDQTDR